MKKVAILLSCLGIAACQTVPVSQKFPIPPDVLMQTCGPLSTIDKEEVLLSEFTKTVTGNYQKYHNCAALVEAWQEWYKENAAIFNQANK